MRRHPTSRSCRSLLSLLFLLFVALPATAQARREVDLRPRFESGEQIRYEMRTETGGSLGFGKDSPIDAPKPTTTRQRLDLLLQVQETDPETGTLIEVVVEGAWIQIESDGSTISYDTASKRKPAPSRTGRPAADDPNDDSDEAMLARLAEGMVGSVVTIRLDPTGKVTSISVPSSIPNLAPTPSSPLALAPEVGIPDPNNPEASPEPSGKEPEDRQPGARKPGTATPSQPRREPASGPGPRPGKGASLLATLFAGFATPFDQFVSVGHPTGLARVGEEWTTQDSLGGPGGLQIDATHKLLSGSGAMARVKTVGRIQAGDSSPMLRSGTYDAEYKWDTREGRLDSMDARTTLELGEGPLAFEVAMTWAVRLAR